MSTYWFNPNYRSSAMLGAIPGSYFEAGMVGRCGSVFALALSLSLGTASHLLAQTTNDSGCKMASPVFVTGEPNIFNDQQEQDLGDALAEAAEADLKLVPVGADDEMTRIGERLLATLPPTGVHYRFRIYDSGEVNGFSLAGGRVYISRKLVAAVKNEDELAGVIAHEIGHVSTHQIAIEFTRMLRIRLGVTKVTDRADIFARVHQLFSTPAKSSEDQDREKADQIAADHVALYALVKAGYDPQTFASFMNESMVNKGKKGNWLSDAFGITHEESQRYRTALKVIATLPEACRVNNPKPSDPAFQTWLHSLLEERVKSIAVGKFDDKQLKLDPPLRPSLWRVRFSLDGKYVLGQDEGGITVADREAGKMLFRIDAPDVEMAHFTPDSQSVVFQDASLRVEEWSIVKGQRTRVKELVLFDPCDQSQLSPDGKTLVCVSLVMTSDSGHVRLRLVDVDTGNVFFDKPKFVEPSRFGLLLNMLNPSNLGNIEISADSKILIFAAAGHVMGYDLEHRTEVALGGELKKLTDIGTISFADSTRLYIVGEPDSKKMRPIKYVNFPQGQVMSEVQYAGQWAYSTTRGTLMRAGPVKDSGVALWDFQTAKIVAESHNNVIDVWNRLLMVESVGGGLAIQDLDTRKVTLIALPLGELPRPQAATFSEDGKYLALSLKERSEIWNLESGKQVGLLRPFHSLWFDAQDQVFAQFPKFLDKDPVLKSMNLSTSSSKDLGKFEDKDLQYRNLQIRYNPMGKDKNVNRHASLEVRKMEGATIAWSRDYPKETPVCWPAEDDRLVLAWDMSNDTARSEIKTYPALQKEADLVKKKGLLLEIVAPETGAPLQQVIVPEADITKGREDTRRASVSGDFVLARGEHSNTVIYRIQDASKVGEFFGTAVATDAQSGMIAAVNREDEILLVQENNGKELNRFSLGSPVRLARIIGDKEKTLLVLTADQVVHRISLSQLQPKNN
jgi:WD40 repeat protein